MKTEVKEIAKNIVEIDIEIESKVSDKEYEKACRRIAQSVNIAGFRKGKAPRNILERHVGVEAIKREALDAMLPKVFTDVIRENDYELITEPTLLAYNLETGKYDYSASVDYQFTIDKEGNLSSKRIVNSSHVDSLDNSVLLALSKVNGFNIPPDDYKGERVHILFKINPNGDSQVVYPMK